MRSRLFPILAAATAILALGACGDSDDSDSGAGASTTTAASTSGTAKSHTEATEEELEKWQTDLNAVGCWSGPVDGLLGPETEAAITEFQTAEGLTVDGLLGPQTESALSAAVSAGTTVCQGGGGGGGGGGSGETGTTVTLAGADYSETFSVTSCTNPGQSDLVLQAVTSGGLTLSVDAPAGLGTLTVTGGSEQETLNGNVESVTVGADGALDATGTFAPPNFAGEPFTITGTCA